MSKKLKEIFASFALAATALAASVPAMAQDHAGTAAAASADNNTVSSTYRDARNPNATQYDAASARSAASIGILGINVSVPATPQAPEADSNSLAAKFKNLPPNPHAQPYDAAAARGTIGITIGPVSIQPGKTR